MPTFTTLLKHTSRFTRNPSSTIRISTVSNSGFRSFSTALTRCRVLTETSSHVIYASEHYNYRTTDIKGPRFDPILVKKEDHSARDEYKSYEIARARLFFSITLHGKKVDLALVDMYKKVSSLSSSSPQSTTRNILTV